MTAHPDTARTPAAGDRWRAAARYHRAFVIMLGAAVAIRLLVMKAYRPAFWYDGDSGAYLDAAAKALSPETHLAYGYVVFLAPFRFTHTVATVVGVQHLLGLGSATGVYALLQRRAVPRWISCVAVAPLLFDVIQISIEHHILGETLYTSLLFGAVGLLLWRPQPSTVYCAIAGLLLAGAWCTKPLALPIAAVLVGYLMLRRTGWRRWTAFMIAFVIPYVSLLAWIGGNASPYGANNLALYSRMAGIADCEHLTLTAAQRAICPAPAIRGHRPDWYAWVPLSPGYPYRTNRANDPILREFALAVIRQQPLDYLAAVGQEIAPHFVDGISPGPDFDCLRGRYSLPATAQDVPSGACHPELAAANFTYKKATTKYNPGPTTLRRAFSIYSGAAHTTLPVTAAFILTLLALLARWRAHRHRALSTMVVAHRRGPDALAGDAATLALIAGAIIVAPVVVGMYEPRYALPALPFVGLALGFSARTLSLSRRRPIIAVPVPVPAPFATATTAATTAATTTATTTDDLASSAGSGEADPDDVGRRRGG